MTHTNNLQELCKLIRYDILTATTEAGSGHPTSSLSGTELMATLWFGGFLHVDFAYPKAISNDRIIFSKGHAAPLLYAMYHAAGVISQEELLSLRKFGSKIEGHPTPDFEQIDVATGSLGQGLSAGLGMALGVKHHMKSGSLKIDREPKVFVVLGDSEMAEGQVWEAMQLASYYKVNNLVGIIDVNRLGQRGPTMLEWDLETYKKRAESFGWEAIVVDGANIEEITKAYEQAVHATEKPTMIIAKTKKGQGITALADMDDWHGKPLPKDKMEAALQELGNLDTTMKGAVAKPKNAEIKLPKNTSTDVEAPYEMSANVATREAYGTALVELAKKYPQLVALDAETSNSTYAEKLKKTDGDKFYEMFIAEQNMASTAVGMSKVELVPFISSFAAFFTRAFDQIRMAQYSEANVKVVGSHAGVSIGVDGSSQMALEDLAMMRSILHGLVLYPSDAVSTIKLAEELIKHQGIGYMRLTREKTPIIYDKNEQFVIGGSRIVKSSDNDSIVIIAAGITLHEALKAHTHLQQEGIHVTVIDAYSVKPLDEKTIKEQAIKTGKVIVVEDHYPCGGLGEAVKTALCGKNVQVAHLCVNKIPHSGQPEELLRFAEIDTQAIIAKVKEMK